MSVSAELDAILNRHVELENAITNVADLAGKVTADRKTLEQLRDEHVKKVAESDATLSAKLADAEKARHQAALSEAEFGKKTAEVQAKIAKLDAVLKAVGE